MYCNSNDSELWTLRIQEPKGIITPSTSLPPRFISHAIPRPHLNYLALL